MARQRGRHVRAPAALAGASTGARVHSGGLPQSTTGESYRAIRNNLLAIEARLRLGLEADAQAAAELLAQAQRRLADADGGRR